MLSTKEELEALLRTLDVWVIVFGVFVAIGVAGESLVGFIHFRKSSQLHRLQTAENLAQQAEIERLRSDTAMSMERAAHAEQQAAESNKIAEGEQLARVQLQRLVTWRTLTPAQQTEIGAQLRKYAGIRFAVTVNAGDPEGFSFASQIATALRNGAKWDLVAFAPVMNLGGFKIGVTITTTGDANTMSASDALTHELLARGFDAVRSPEIDPRETDPLKRPLLYINVQLKPVIGQK